MRVPADEDVHIQLPLHKRQRIIAAPGHYLRTRHMPSVFVLPNSCMDSPAGALRLQIPPHLVAMTEANLEASHLQHLQWKGCTWSQNPATAGKQSRQMGRALTTVPTSSSGYFDAASSKFPRVMWMSVHTVFR